MVSDESVPRLFAVSRPLPGLPSLLDHADPHHPLLWTRGDRGCVGIGEALRLSFRGPRRFDDAAEAWRRIAALARVDDPVSLPGSGLIAFGTFAFDDQSEAASVLIVPRFILSRHESAAWITEISREEIAARSRRRL